MGLSGDAERESSLLNCLDSLETFDEGSIFVNGIDVGKLLPQTLHAHRRIVAMIFRIIYSSRVRWYIKILHFRLSVAGIVLR